MFYNFQEFIELINSQLIPLVNGYGTGGNDDGLVDTIQQFVSIVYKFQNSSDDRVVRASASGAMQSGC